MLPEPGPLRVLTIASLVNTVGRGLFLAIAAIHYTRVAGLPVTMVGVALSAAALVAAAAPLQWGPVGWGILAVMFVLAGAAVPTVRWAERTRTTAAVPAPAH